MDKLITLVFIAVVFMSVITGLHLLNESEKNFEPTSPFTMENAVRVRNNIPKETRINTPVIQYFSQTAHQEEITCLQKNIYFEARNQTTVAQIGVAWVTLNRATNGKTICDVVYRAKLDSNGNPRRHKCQFSWYCDGKGDTPNLRNKVERDAWVKAGNLAFLMVRSCMVGVETSLCPEDPTNGATHYHAKTVSPSWKLAMNQAATIDDHIFYTTE
jgi:spore germination cell wall hydrolase CwlJ-like protein